MADSKISALPASTTPLAGTEVLPIVQSGATKQVSVANLTAGRAISATQLTLTTGNLIVANGQGIDFSATPNPSGMTSELFADYEEGTWTPTIIGTSTAGTASYGTQSATYTKIGRMVYFQLELIWSGGTGTGSLRITGLPFTCAAANCAVSIGDIENVSLTALYTAGAYVITSSTQISLREFAVGGGGNNPVAYDAAGTIRIGGCYYV